jgi:hypothetical protein
VSALLYALCLFQFWEISLISVSDGLDMREEHANDSLRAFSGGGLGRVRDRHPAGALESLLGRRLEE